MSKEKKSNLFDLLNLNPWDTEESERFNDNAVLDAIKHNPHSATIKYNFECWGTCFPVVPAVGLGASRHVVDRLIQLCPESIYEKSGWGETPLHYACRYCYRTSSDVIRLLVESNPGALACHNTTGWTPLHMALAYMTAELDVIEFLISKSTESSLRVQNHTGSTPLHMACSNYHVSSLVLRPLIETHPDAMRVKDLNGETPFMIVERNTYVMLLPSFLNCLRILDRLLTAKTDDIHYGPPPPPPPPSDDDDDDDDEEERQREEECMIEMLDAFVAEEWGFGITLVLDSYPKTVHKLHLDDAVMPYLLYKIGRDCKVFTMFQVLRERPNIIAQCV